MNAPSPSGPPRPADTANADATNALVDAIERIAEARPDLLDVNKHGNYYLSIGEGGAYIYPGSEPEPEDLAVALSWALAVAKGEGLDTALDGAADDEGDSFYRARVWHKDGKAKDFSEVYKACPATAAVLALASALSPQHADAETD